MRKVVAYELLSLDGVAERPDGFFADWDDAMDANLGAVIEYLFQNSGRPTGYVLGTEGGGALLAGVRYGQAAKLFLSLAAPAPPSQTLSVPLRFWTWTQRGADGEPLPAACSFAGSPSALELLEVDRGPETWVAAVRRLRPDRDYADGSPLLSTWHDDPWARGAYSARTLSSPLADEPLARPIGVVTFAGEHTAGRWHGLMEGALRSGLRAAAQVNHESSGTAAD